MKEPKYLLVEVTGDGEREHSYTEEEFKELKKEIAETAHWYGWLKGLDLLRHGNIVPEIEVFKLQNCTSEFEELIISEMGKGTKIGIRQREERDRQYYDKRKKQWLSLKEEFGDK